MMNEETRRKLSELNLTEFITALEIQETTMNDFNLSFDERISHIVDFIYQEKYNQKVQRLKKRAHLRYPNADLRDVHYTEKRPLTKESVVNIAACHFLYHYQDIVIEAPCGTGKTWFSCAIGNQAILLGKNVYYIRYPDLMENFTESRKMGKSTSSIVRKYAKFNLLIIDDFLMHGINDDSQKMFLSQLVEERYDKTTTIYAGQYKIENWYKILGEDITAEAILDRIIHHMISIDLCTENFR